MDSSNLVTYVRIKQVCVNVRDCFENDNTLFMRVVRCAGHSNSGDGKELVHDILQESNR
jgi:hypothetical protein